MLRLLLLALLLLPAREAAAETKYACDQCGHVYNQTVDGPLGCKAA